jgi:hypothetical protein
MTPMQDLSVFQHCESFSARRSNGEYTGDPLMQPSRDITKTALMTRTPPFGRELSRKLSDRQPFAISMPPGISQFRPNLIVGSRPW